MRAAIDMQDLRVLHIHQLAGVVHGLVYLEAKSVKHVAFENTDRPGFLDGLTTLELTLLYRNTTKSDFPPNVADDLTRRQMIADLINAATPRDVNQEELEDQIEHVAEKLEDPADTTAFRYVKGARVPAISDGGLFPLTAYPVSMSKVAAAAQLAAQRLSTRAAPTAAPAPAPRAQPATRRATGSVRPVVWAHADKVWEAAGKPTDKDAVLELRKRMMTELEDQGIKRTSSSTSLGEWMKDRLG